MHMSASRLEGTLEEEQGESSPLIDGIDKETLVVPSGDEGEEGERRKMAWRPRCSRKLKKTILSIVLGQILSILLCAMGVFNQRLKTNFSYTSSISQAYAAYLLMSIVFAPLYACRSDFVSSAKKQWWKYALLALVGVEGNYLMVTSQQYTSLTSMQLLDNAALIFVIILSFLFLRIRYGITHLTGVGSCLLGMVLLVMSDVNKPQQGTVTGAPLGDIFVLAATFLYAVSNVAQEFLVKKHSIVEFLALLGLFATLFSGIQMCILESDSLAATNWLDYRLIGNLIGFVACLYSFTALMPFVMRRSSAALINISLLTSDFYGLIFGVFLFNYTFSWLYVMAFVFVIVGVIVYNVKQTQVAPHGIHDTLVQNIRACLRRSES